MFGTCVKTSAILFVQNAHKIITKSKFYVKEVKNVLPNVKEIH